MASSVSAGLTAPTSAPGLSGVARMLCSREGAHLGRGGQRWPRPGRRRRCRAGVVPLAGIGEKRNKAVPMLVRAFEGVRVRDVAIGGYHSIAITGALAMWQPAAASCAVGVGIWLNTVYGL